MRAEIKSFLAKNAGISEEDLVDDLDLFEGEIWDSLLLVRFFSYAEKRFGVHIDLARVREEDVRTISEMEKFLLHMSSVR